VKELEGQGRERRRGQTMQAAASESSSKDVSEHDKKHIAEERERNRLVHQAIAEVRAQAGAYLAIIPTDLTCLVAFLCCGLFPYIQCFL
jgi:hypothetical protein